MTAELSTPQYRSRFEVKLENFMDEQSLKILDDLLRESRKEIFESRPDLTIPK